MFICLTSFIWGLGVELITTGLDKVHIEEVVECESEFLVGIRDEKHQRCKFVRVLSKDEEFECGEIYITPVNAIRRVRTNRGYGRETMFFVEKCDIIAKFDGDKRRFKTVTEIDGSKVADQRRGIPKLEYI